MEHDVEPPERAAGDASTLRGVGEDALVTGMVSRLRPLPGWVDVGPGDDAAVLELSGAVVASTDTLVEGRDFLRQWSSAHQVGVKLAAQNFADIAAMGAIPLALLVSLAAPETLAAQWSSGLVDGLDDESARAGAHVVGGDVSGAAEIVLTGTALGRLPAGIAPVRRSGARPGDVVALAGRTGRSAAGWALLRAGSREALLAHAELVEAHLAPRPPYAAGVDAGRAGASSMIDTSDGLVRDAIRLATASGVVVDLRSAALAPSDGLLAAAAALSAPAGAADRAEPGAARRRARQWVMTGGEDHALLATFPAGTPLPVGWLPVGEVRAPEAGGLQPASLLVDGEPWTGPTGWTHFDGSA